MFLTAVLNLQYIDLSSSWLGLEQRNILVLGSGFVSRPAIEVLSDAGFYVTVGELLKLVIMQYYNSYSNARTACRTLEKAKKQAEGVKNASATALDVSDDIALDREVSKSALIISLIPYVDWLLLAEFSQKLTKLS